MNEWASASTTWHGMAWPGLVGWLGYLVWGWDWDWLTLTDWGKVSDIECGNSLWRTWNDRTVVNFWMVPQILKLFFGLMFWVVVAGCVKGRRAATTNQRLWLRSSRFFFSSSSPSAFDIVGDLRKGFLLPCYKKRRILLMTCFSSRRTQSSVIFSLLQKNHHLKTFQRQTDTWVLAYLPTYLLKGPSVYVAVAVDR